MQKVMKPHCSKTVFILAVSTFGMILSACDRGPQFVYDGGSLYMSNCANCHGATASGDGPVGAILAVSVPDLRVLKQRNDGQFPSDRVRRTIDGREMPMAHGERYMPVWGSEFLIQEGADAKAEERVQLKIGALVEFLESIQD